jgi:thiol-disulfide isomerase/thioredoxin
MSPRAALVAVTVLALPLPLVAADTRPATRPGATRPAAKRTLQQIDADINQALNEVTLHRYALLGGGAKKEAEAAPKVRRVVDLLQERMAAAPTVANVARPLLYSNLATLALLGEGAAREKLEADSESKVPADAAAGKAALAAVRWYKAWPKEAEQLKEVDALKALAKANPREDVITHLVSDMLDAKNASAAHELALARIILDDLKGPGALRAVPDLAPLVKRNELVGKPLTIRANTADGRPFSSDSYKGKVVLVDFWATWCPPCREELPHVIKLYSEYHDKGLEIVGVSSDNDIATLKQFVKGTAGMTWVQLCTGGADWHPLTKQYGVTSVPTVFVIDRNGICRSVSARSQLDTLVPELLKEEPKAATTAATTTAATQPASQKKAGR